MKSSYIYELGCVSLNQELFFFKITSVWRAEAICAAGQSLCFVCFWYEALGGWGIKYRGTMLDLIWGRGQLNGFPDLHASCEIYREIKRMMQFPPLNRPNGREDLGV